MAQTRPNKAVVPINSDEYNLTTDLATMADSLNVVVPVYGEAERDELPKTVGLTVSRLDARGWIQVWTGTEWQAPSPFSMAAGTVIINMPKDANFTPVNITFPAGRFTQPPIIICQFTSSVGGSQAFTVRSYNPTIAGATIGAYIATWDTNAKSTVAWSTNVGWQAIQMTPDNSAG